MTRHLKVVFWDLDDVVIIDNDYKTDIAQRYGLERDHVRRICKGPPVNLYKAGKLTDEAFWPQLIEELGAPVTEEELVCIMSKGRLDSRILTLMEELRQEGVINGALTDANRRRIEYIDATLGLKHLFHPDLFITSYDVGALKPDRQMFQAAVDAALGVVPGTSPCQIAVIDDKTAYMDALSCMAFRGVGCHALSYSTPEKLRDDLNVLN